MVRGSLEKLIEILSRNDGIKIKPIDKSEKSKTTIFIKKYGAEGELKVSVERDSEGYIVNMNVNAITRK